MESCYEYKYRLFYVHHSGDAPIQLHDYDTLGLAISAALKQCEILKWDRYVPVTVEGDLKILQFHICNKEPNPPWVQIREL